MTEHTLTVDETMDRSDSTGADGTGGQSTEPTTGLADVGAFTEGATAPHDLYVVHGWYENVVEADGVTLTPVERPYPADRFATSLAPGERGNLLVAAGETVSADVAAQLTR